ncbi:hypothetical protein D9M71_852090 [compost metagenome]
MVVEVEPFDAVFVLGDAIGQVALDQRLQEGGDLLGALKVLLAGACHLHSGIPSP